MSAEHLRRVLLTADTVGGVFAYAVELARALTSRGIEVVLATMGGALRASQWDQLAGLPAVAVYESGYRLEWMDDAWRDVERASAWLLHLEGLLAPDIVHLNQFAFGALPFAAPKLVVGHSCVASWWHAVRGCDAPGEWDRYRREVEQGLEGADLVVAPSRFMLEALREHYGYEGPAEVIANARSADTWTPGPKEPFVLSAGRLWDDAKNLGALERVAAEMPWPIRVAGPLQGPAGGTRRTSVVEVLGELSCADLRREFARAAIYALPARYEPFGLSALEAALCGCALVLGDIPSLREVWGDAAWFVAPDDHRALAAALKALAADEPLRQAMAHKARRRALAYPPERMADAYLAAYRRILDRPRPATHVGASPRATPEERACAS